MRSITLVTVPIALGLVAVARPLVLTVFGEKWADAIPVLSAIAIYTLIRSLTFNVGDVYKARGEPGILTRLSLLKLPSLLPALWWAATGPGTIVAIGWTQVAIAIVMGMMNLYVASRLLKMPLRKILAAFAPALFGGIIMAMVVMGTLSALTQLPEIVQLIAGILVGALVYLTTMWLIQRDFVLQASSSLRVAFNRS